MTTHSRAVRMVGASPGVSLPIGAAMFNAVWQQRKSRNDTAVPAATLAEAGFDAGAGRHHR